MLVACVHAAALPLQLLALRMGGGGETLAVVDKDKPLGWVLSANAAARAEGVKEGMRYGEALSLVPRLRAGVVRDDELKAAHLALHQMLLGFSPQVEPAAAEHGTFWLDASGLKRLFGTREHWSNAIRETLRAQGFSVRVVVGEHRFDVYCLARAGPSVSTREAVPLRALLGGVAALDVSTVQELELLGVSTLGDVARMPLAPLQERYPRFAQWWSQAQEIVPLQGVGRAPRYAERMQFEPPDADRERLLFACKHLLARLLPRLARERLAVSALRIDWVLERSAGAIDTCLETAQPVLDERVLVDLVRLKLESLALPLRVCELRVETVVVAATTEQLALFTAKQERTVESAQRALARVRAALGDVAGVPVLRAFHSPERQFEWEAVAQLRAPAVAAPVRISAGDRASLAVADTEADKRVEVKRVDPPRLRLLARDSPQREVEVEVAVVDPSHAAAGPLLVRRLWAQPRRLTHAPPALAGPYRVKSGWGQIARDYYYARGEGGELWWVFYDTAVREWFVHGVVD